MEYSLGFSLVKLQMSNTEDKIIKDPLYSHVHIPELCRHFMDVPEFQRLRRVKQLGNVHYAYPSAVHTRFEHSIGVMHLTGKVVDHLRRFIDISNRTKELIQLAGLYHDIGHFALSHLFDTFLKDRKDREGRDDRNDRETREPYIILRGEKIYLEHEYRSIRTLKRVNRRLDLLSPEELKFVVECINPTETETVRSTLPAVPAVPAVYQIVNNKQCGIDVDKLDYLARDAYHTNFPGFQCGYIIECMRIRNGNIVFLNKAKDDITDLFETRRRMFRMVYQHHTCFKVDQIYKYMMGILEDELFIYGTELDDFNLETILRSNKKTRDIMYLLDCRSFNTLTKFITFTTFEYQPGSNQSDVTFISKDEYRTESEVNE